MRPLWVPAGTLSGTSLASSVGIENSSPKRGLGDVDRHFEQQVVALALEEAMRLNVQHHVQMPGHAAARRGLALRRSCATASPRPSPGGTSMASVCLARTTPRP